MNAMDGFTLVDASVNKWRCDECGWMQKKYGSTSSNFVLHRRSVHGIERVATPERQTKFLEKLVTFLVCSVISFNILSSDHFKKLVAFLDPTVRLPSRQLFSAKLISERAMAIRAKILQKFYSEDIVVLNSMFMDPRFNAQLYLNNHDTLFRHAFSDALTTDTWTKIEKDLRSELFEDLDSTSEISSGEVTDSNTNNYEAWSKDYYDEPLNKKRRLDEDELAVADEMEIYKGLITKNRPQLNSSPLEWWRKHEKLLPTLSARAMILFSLKPTSACVERLFSLSTNLTSNAKRSNLKPEKMTDLLEIQANQKWVEDSNSLFYEEDIEIGIEEVSNCDEQDPGEEKEIEDDNMPHKEIDYPDITDFD